MLVSLRLQTQLASIMDILAKSAVAEICRLIDDGSAVWQLEVTRCQKENESLRWKLRRMERELELRASRGRRQEIEFAAVEEGVPDIIFIKEEKREGHVGKSDSKEGWERDGEGAEGVSHGPPDSGEGGPVEQAHCEEEWGVAPPPPKEEEEFDERQRLCPGEGEPRGVGGGVKVESEGDCAVFRRPGQSGPKSDTGQLDTLGPESVTLGVGQGCRGAVEMGVPDPSCGAALYEVTEEETSALRSVYLRRHAPSSEGGVQPRWAVLESQGRARDCTGQRQITCMYCGKHFPYLSYLKRHLRIHTGEKPFSCIQCGKRFSDGSSRNKHENIHTGRKPFSCLHCGRCFTRHCHLKRHAKLHAEELPFGRGRPSFSP